MRQRSIFSSICAFCLALILTVSCTSSTPPSTPSSTGSGSPAPSGAALKLGFSAWPGWFPWQVAQDEGIFKANNLAVDLKWFDGYLESLSALSTKQIDANSQTLSDTLSAVSKGADQVVVLVNDNSTGNDQIIVAPEIKAITDLKGKKIAVEEGTVDHYLLLLGLKKAGLAASDIQLVPLETGQAAAAFVAKKVDAVAAFAPFTTNAMKRPGSKVLFSSKDFPGAISDHLVFTREYVNQHPDRVQAAVDSWFATLDYMGKNQNKANEIMAKRGSVTLPEYLEYANGTKIFTVADNLKAFQPGTDRTSLAFAAKDISTFLVEAKLADKQPDLSKLFDDRFVKAYAAKSSNEPSKQPSSQPSKS
jgi:NitT/TauT family transport system substrate-binding protein